MKSSHFLIIPALLFGLAAGTGLPARSGETIQWKHLSTADGDLPVPNSGTQQTSSAVFDVDKDGVNDFVITERTQAPAVVWYRRGADGWTKYTVESGPLHIEAGSDFYDVDGDGDLDFVAGGDWMENRVWWWENPFPDYKEEVPWKRHEIKNSGQTKHHDLIFGDFDGDGRDELVFWNQGAGRLFWADIPENPRATEPWECVPIYSWSEDSEMQQRGTYPAFKSINEHEGLAKADIDGDGTLDIIGGGRWFKHLEGNTFAVNIVDAGYAFSRAAAGQLIEGGRPEIVLVVGDGVAPLMLYEWRKGTWSPQVILPEVDNGHSLAVLDFNGDGHLDIFNAEMRLDGGNPDAKNLILLGDGQGNFTTLQISSGIGLHESKIADLDGDGDFDILGKPYNWQTPRLDIWLNQSR